MKFLLIFISVLFLLPNFLKIKFEKKPVYNKVELFDPSLARINSVQKLINYADSLSEKKYADDSLEYAVTVSSIIKERFYHGFSKYTLSQNWIAVVTEYIFGQNVDCIVNPEEILQYPYAACSQQAIVLMEVMKRKNIPYRSLGFPHHYATELKFNDSWYFFDPNMEPKLDEEERDIKNWKHCADSLKKFYNASLYPLDLAFGKSLKVQTGEVNAKPAPRAVLFQNTTRYLSKLLWIFPLLILVYRPKLKD